MNDLIPLGTGNSRFLKSGISPNTTYQQLLTMLINGTFPFDFNGINPAGISQMGSAYNVANVLPEDVCTELDIPNISEPKDAFLALNNLISQAQNVGVYVGTGATSFTLNFASAPKLVRIYGFKNDYRYINCINASIPGVNIVGQETYSFQYMNANGNGIKVNSTWSNNGLTLTISGSSSAMSDINNLSSTYYYSTR